MIRTVLGAATVMFLLAANVASVLAQNAAPPAASAALDQLKSLAGAWEGKNGQQSPVTLRYEIVSGGSAVMERLQPANEPEMITMYSIDGNRLVATHYCSAGNQPTMETGPLSAGAASYQFHLLRVAGTKSPDEGHMVELTLASPDKNHLTQIWTFADHGKSQSQTISYTRKL